MGHYPICSTWSFKCGQRKTHHKDRSTPRGCAVSHSISVQLGDRLNYMKMARRQRSILEIIKSNFRNAKFAGPTSRKNWIIITTYKKFSSAMLIYWHWQCLHLVVKGCTDVLVRTLRCDRTVAQFDLPNLIRTPSSTCKSWSMSAFAFLTWT